MAIYNSACNRASCLINDFDVTITGVGSEVTFTLVDPCNKLTHAGLLRNVLQTAVKDYVALESIVDSLRKCHEGSTCCCGYPIVWTLGTKSATIDFGAAHTYDDVDELTVTAPFDACNS